MIIPQIKYCTNYNKIRENFQIALSIYLTFVLACPHDQHGSYNTGTLTYSQQHTDIHGVENL